MMSREDSPFTESPPRRPCTSCARSGRPRLAPMVSHICTPVTAEPSGTPTPSSRCTTPSGRHRHRQDPRYHQVRLRKPLHDHRRKKPGRVGTIMSRERHPGSFDIVHIKDSQGHTFATRIGYVFIIGKGSKAYISLPKGKGVKLSIAEERDKRLGVKRD